MRITRDSVYRTETVKGDKLVVAVGIKPDMDSRDNRDIDRYLDCMEVREMSRYNYSCANECGDEDCGKCMKRGIIMECPPDCTDYEPNFPVEYKHKPKEKE